jgi:hypothetical protein
LICLSRRGSWCLVFSLVVIPLVGVISPAWAGHRTGRTHRTVTVYRARPLYAPKPFPAPTLGTFMPTPSIIVRGNDPVGGGYSPLGIYGEQTMSLYGPFSPLRPATAPVNTYTRGYSGEVRLTQGISSSYPNLPVLSPVIYPTEANNYYGPRILRTPWWDSAINWIDQN